MCCFSPTLSIQSHIFQVFPPKFFEDPKSQEEEGFEDNSCARDGLLHNKHCLLRLNPSGQPLWVGKDVMRQGSRRGSNEQGFELVKSFQQVPMKGSCHRGPLQACWCSGDIASQTSPRDTPKTPSQRSRLTSAPSLSQIWFLVYKVRLSSWAVR